MAVYDDDADLDPAEKKRLEQIRLQTAESLKTKGKLGDGKSAAPPESGSDIKRE